MAVLLYNIHDFPPTNIYWRAMPGQLRREGTAECCCQPPWVLSIAHLHSSMVASACCCTCALLHALRNVAHHC